MSRVVCVCLAFFGLMLFVNDLPGQSSIFVRRSEIPIAPAGTIEGYYDVQSGDVLLSIGEGVVIHWKHVGGIGP